MKLNFYFSIIFAALLTLKSTNLVAKTLVVSDIDDTIKVSHILDKSDAIDRSGNTNTPFVGMAQLFQIIIKQNQNTQIVYLSNAPKSILGFPGMQQTHEKFIKDNKFPEGPVLLRADVTVSNHKITQIRKLMNQIKPELVVFIGDNGEQDAAIYNQAVGEFKDKAKFFTFIRQVYYSKSNDDEKGKLLFANQIGFVTPIEISLILKDAGMILDSGMDWMYQNISPYIVSETKQMSDRNRPVAFASFQDCRDFKWKWSLTPETQALVNKIKARCN